MSEFNIKRKVRLCIRSENKIKEYNQQEVTSSVMELLPKFQEFYALDQLVNASSILIPPLLKEMKSLHPNHYSVRELQPFHKNLRFVGYSLSYLDGNPEILQTRVLKSKETMFAQVTVGVRAIEVGYGFASDRQDIYGWTDRGKKVKLEGEFPEVCN